MLCRLLCPPELHALPCAGSPCGLSHSLRWARTACCKCPPRRRGPQLACSAGVSASPAGLIVAAPCRPTCTRCNAVTKPPVVGPAAMRAAICSTGSTKLVLRARAAPRDPRCRRQLTRCGPRWQATLMARAPRTSVNSGAYSCLGPLPGSRRAARELGWAGLGRACTACYTRKSWQGCHAVAQLHCRPLRVFRRVPERLVVYPFCRCRAKRERRRAALA